MLCVACCDLMMVVWRLALFVVRRLVNFVVCCACVAACCLPLCVGTCRLLLLVDVCRLLSGVVCCVVCAVGVCLLCVVYCVLFVVV